MVRRDIARERLQTIRKLQGWREAYKAGGFKDEGSDATRRRRLSRAINRKTTGAKTLDSKQRRKINQTFKTKTRQKAFAKGRTRLEIKSINKIRTEARKKARSTFGPGGTYPNPAMLKTRLRQNKNLTADEKERIEEAFDNIREDGGVAARAEYRTLLATVKITNLPPRQRESFKRRLKKAEQAVIYDEQKTAHRKTKSKKPFLEWIEGKWKASGSSKSLKEWRKNARFF